MSKFKIGDKVKIINKNAWAFGKIGEIIKFDNRIISDPHPWLIRIKDNFGNTGEVYYNELAFKLINSTKIREKLGIK